MSPSDMSWPETGVLLEGPGVSLRLTREDGEAVREALLAYFSGDEARRQIGEPFASRPGTWTVGAPWLSPDGPRMDAYYLAAGASDEVILSRTLEVRPAGRYGIEARLRREAGGWVVTSFGAVITHHRR